MDPGLLHFRAGGLDWELLGFDGCINIPSPSLMPCTDSCTPSPQSPQGGQPASWASGWGVGGGVLSPWPGPQRGLELGGGRTFSAKDLM